MELTAGSELPDGMEEDQPAPVSMLSDCVAPLLAHLPDKYRDALRRADLGGETLVTLAEEEGLSASALKSRAQRARKMLREAIVASCETELDRRGRLISAGETKKGCC
jgi:RNA polymerase sigma-70 factor (ECF subfamily)